MTTPFWCLLAAILLPYVLAGVGGYFRMRQFGRIDNKHPRQQAAALEGAGARAYAAQQNAWEALAVFAPSVLVAHVAGADPDRSAIAALAFLAARVVHPVAYLANVDALRSLSFLVGFLACLYLFRLAAVA